MRQLLLLFIFIPFIELMILIKLGDYIGFWPTLTLLILMGLLGFAMVRSQGFFVVYQIKQDLANGIPPARSLMEGLYVFAGGLMLITPGLITDIIGLLLLLPPSRLAISRIITPWVINKMFNSGRWHIRRW
ncbi:MAG: FxsA family protein [Firmicutes bacterium]|nr:FxsA family protein [Bacillota bacterium]